MFSYLYTRDRIYEYAQDMVYVMHLGPYSNCRNFDYLILYLLGLNLKSNYTVLPIFS